MDRSERALKNFGGASLHPREFPYKYLKETYLFFLAFFFAAILFSSELLNFFASVAGEARIHHHV